MLQAGIKSKNNIISDFFAQSQVKYKINNSKNQPIIVDKHSLEGNLVFLNKVFSIYNQVLQKVDVDNKNNLFKRKTKSPFFQLLKTKDKKLTNQDILDTKDQNGISLFASGKDFNISNLELIFKDSPFAFWALNYLLDENIIDKNNLTKSFLQLKPEDKTIKGLGKINQELKVFKTENWIPVWQIISFWIGICSLLVVSVFFIHFRKDFK